MFLHSYKYKILQLDLNERSDSSSWEASVFADVMFSRIKTGEIAPRAGIKFP